MKSVDFKDELYVAISQVREALTQASQKFKLEGSPLLAFEGVELELGLEYVQKSDEKMDFVIVKLAEGREQKRTHVIRLRLKEYNPSASDFNPTGIAFPAIAKDDDTSALGSEQSPEPRKASKKRKNKRVK